jgi:hypothetical protein
VSDAAEPIGCYKTPNNHIRTLAYLSGCLPCLWAGEVRERVQKIFDSRLATANGVGVGKGGPETRAPSPESPTLHASRLTAHGSRFTVHDPRFPPLRTIASLRLCEKIPSANQRCDEGIETFPHGSRFTVHGSRLTVFLVPLWLLSSSPKPNLREITSSPRLTIHGSRNPKSEIRNQRNPAPLQTTYPPNSSLLPLIYC